MLWGTTVAHYSVHLAEEVMMFYISISALRYCNEGKRWCHNTLMTAHYLLQVQSGSTIEKGSVSLFVDLDTNSHLHNPSHSKAHIYTQSVATWSKEEPQKNVPNLMKSWQTAPQRSTHHINLLWNGNLEWQENILLAPLLLLFLLYTASGFVQNINYLLIEIYYISIFVLGNSKWISDILVF